MFEHRSHAQRGTLAHSGARSSGWAWGFVWSATLALGWPVPSGAGIALQSVDTSWGVFLGWLAGAALGSYSGVAGGIRLRSLVAGT